VTVVVSAMLDLLPGDPAQAILGPDATPEQLAALRAQLNLDDPFWVRYWHWVSSLLQGDFGTSYRTNIPVRQTILERVPVSLELMLLAQVIAIGTALLLAIYGASRSGGLVDRAAATFSFGVISIPTFTFALVLVLVFAVQLQLLPASGFVPLADGLGANLASVILPALSLALHPLGVYQRILRTDLGATMNENFILAAQARGLSSSAVMFRQALRPSSFGLLTLAGLTTATLLGSTVVVETVFAMPGLGSLMVESIRARDFIVVQAMVALIGLIYVVINGAIDVLYAIIDPRVSHATR
jgi:peptide/nickel transport system permease protein